MKTRLSSKGQVVIPKRYRQQLGLSEGMELSVRVESGKLVLSPLRPERKAVKLDEVAGMLHRPGRPSLTLDEMDRAARAAFKSKQS